MSACSNLPVSTAANLEAITGVSTSGSTGAGGADGDDIYNDDDVNPSDADADAFLQKELADMGMIISEFL